MRTPAPYQHDSETSRKAAEQIFNDLNHLERVVLFILTAHKFLTDEEMQAATGLHGSTQRPRRVSLVEKGLVRDSGTKRKTTAGRMATVWEAVI